MRFKSIGLILSLLGIVVSSQSAITLDQRIEQYIMEHPDVIVKALEMHTKNMANTRLQNIISESTTDIAILNPKGKNRLIAYIDYRCGACKRSFQLIENFAVAHPDVALVLRPLPILGSESTLASLMVYDAMQLNQAKAMSETLFALEGGLDDNVLARVAKQFKLKAIDKPRDHWAFRYLAENYKQSSQLNNQSVPLYILSVGKQSEMFSGISSQQVLEEAYKRLG